MKRSKKIIALTLSAIMAFSLLSMVACGGGQGNGYSDTIDWEKIDWEGNNDTEKDIKVYISNDMQAYYADKIAAFEDAYPQYEVTVDWNGAGDSVKTNQANAIGGGNPPDLVLGGDVHLLNQRGFLLPLNKLIERDAAEVQVDDFMDGFMDSLTSGEGIYYLPTMFNVSLLVYNTDLFDESGVAYPTAEWTFDDFVEAGQTLTKWQDSSRKKAVQWGNETVVSWWTQWYSIYKMNGGELFDANGKVSLNNELGIKSLEQWASLFGVKNQVPYAETKIGTNFGTDGSDLGGFAAGKVAMIYSAHAAALLSYSNAKNLKFEIEQLPMMERADGTKSRQGTELSISAYGIHRNSKNKKGAWALLKWLTAPRTDIDELSKFACPVPRKSEKELLLAVPKAERKTVYKNYEAIYEMMKTSEVLPRVSYFEEVMVQYVDVEVNKILDGVKPSKAAKEAQEMANSYIDYSYGAGF